MRRSFSMWVIVASLLVPRIVSANALPAVGVPTELAIGEGERLLIIAPHPDDETLGAAGIAQRVLARGGTVRTVIVTAGDGFVEAVQRASGEQNPGPSAYVSYGRQRIREASSAAQVLGPRGLRLDVLGFPDGGLLPLLFAHWSHAHPERSPTTRLFSPPYLNPLAHNLAYAGADLRRALGRVLRGFKPTLIAFTDPLDEHSDHRAVGLFSLLSVSDWIRSVPRGTVAPRMLAFVVHWKHWPPDSGQLVVPPGIVDAELALPLDLPTRGQEHACLRLSDEELGKKQEALAKYETQREVLGPFLAAFVRRTECFSLNTALDAAQVDIDIAERLARRAPLLKRNAQAAR